jgi:hypothetical protein
MIRFGLFYILFWLAVFGALLCCSVTEPAFPAMSKEDSAKLRQRQYQRALDSALCAELGEPCPPGRP